MTKNFNINDVINDEYVIVKRSELKFVEEGLDELRTLLSMARDSHMMSSPSRAQEKHALDMASFSVMTFDNCVSSMMSDGCNYDPNSTYFNERLRQEVEGW